MVETIPSLTQKVLMCLFHRIKQENYYYCFGKSIINSIVVGKYGLDNLVHGPKLVVRDHLASVFNSLP